MKTTLTAPLSPAGLIAVEQLVRTYCDVRNARWYAADLAAVLPGNRDHEVAVEALDMAVEHLARICADIGYLPPEDLWADDSTQWVRHMNSVHNHQAARKAEESHR